MLWQSLIAGTTSIGQARMISRFAGDTLPLQQLGVEINLRHEFETRSLPCSLAATLAALPSISLIPSARFTNSHEGTLQGDFSQIVIVRLVKIRAIGVWPLELQQLRFEIDLRACESD